VPPQDTVSEPLRVLIFDSYYDSYRGVLFIFGDGLAQQKDRIRLMASERI